MANEKRLIDANALMLEIEEELAHKSHFLTAEQNEMIDCGLRIAAKDIRFQPTVDAVEVVHGHWCWEGKFKACSRCGSYVEWDETLGASFWKFCPYCGAKMDGDDQ